MKFLFSIFCFLILFNAKGSTNEVVPDSAELKKNVLPFGSQIVINNLPCKGVIVNIYDVETFDFESDSNEILQTFALDKDGVLSLEIPKDVSVIIEVTKKGYIHKRFAVNTSDLPDEVWEKDYDGFVIDSIALFTPTEGIDYKLFDYPLVLVSYDFEEESFTYDKAYFDLALAGIDLVRSFEVQQTILINKQKEELEKAEKNNKLIMFGYSLALIVLVAIIIFLISRGRSKNISNV